MISTNEIKQRAVAFSKRWEKETNEDAEAKTFMDEFFLVFGVDRKAIGARFEEAVKKEDGKKGYIDLLYKKHLLIEFKSRDKDLSKAHDQAKDYFPGIKDEDLPRHLLVCDFNKFKLYDLYDKSEISFNLENLVSYIDAFNFLTGKQKVEFKEQDPVNVNAAYLMGDLHDALKNIGYSGHPLEVLLVRILFCLFAEDTTIFNASQFKFYIEQRTHIDGSDLAAKLHELFAVLNTSPEKRYKNLDEQLAEFPYINGRLFEETLPVASFDSKMREALLKCCSLNWGEISPAIFGSMFQSVMDKKERRNLGAHYTSEKNILKVIKPLFIDELYIEFENCKNNKTSLIELHKKIGNLRILDPACGCGNFLVITYRELRILELEILKKIYKNNQGFLNVSDLIYLNVDQMFGIEYEEFPSRIAEVAMWLIDHQMNLKVGKELGQYFKRIPLTKPANIIHGNALELDWEKFDKVQTEISTKITFDYIIGNPPFIGFKLQNEKQKKELQCVFDFDKGVGVLDYVCGWYIKAAKYINTEPFTKKTRVCFVSTNSICQGEQVNSLWPKLFKEHNIKIHFAHKTFKWSNEAKSNAAVYCIIIAFSNYEIDNKFIFEYNDLNSDPIRLKVANINAYLVDAKNIFLDKRSNPICNAPKMNLANLAYDYGYLTFTKEEKDDFLIIEPDSKKYFRPVVSAYEFLNNKERWCLWLVDALPNDLKKMPNILKRLQIIKENRGKSTRSQTLKAAETPGLFAEIRQPKNNYLAVPITSSENRKYIPIGFFSSEYITSAGIHVIPNATKYDFGIISSAMHVAWVSYTCGRLESRFRYSNTIVYNNYPWPEAPTDKQKKVIEDAAQAVLDTRGQFPDSSLANLYDPYTMPPILVKAHQALDKAVDQCYRSVSFDSETKRVEYLFELYEKYTKK